MPENPNKEINNGGTLSIEELEQKCRANSKDDDLKEELATALVDRYLGGETGQDAGNEADVNRAREVIVNLPESKGFYPRAYLAYLDEKDSDAVQWLEKYASGNDPTNRGEPFSADDLYLDIIEPFAGATKTFWSELAESIDGLWPGSPAALTLAAYVKHEEKKPEEAFGYYERAIKADKDYWLAAWGVGEEHQFQKNWQAASQYYEKTLESDLARGIPDLRFYAAWCAGKVGEHAKEEKHYRACLDLNAEYPFARNNLGWSLYKQRRFDEALAVFDDCIARKLDGAYPKRNRARTLARIGRLSDAIDAWKQTGRGGKVSKQAKEQMDKLQARLNGGEAVPEDDDGEDGTGESESGKKRGR